jgi:MFS family permease
MAGLVGLFTGCGALVALTLFLPMPAQFSKVKGITQGEAVADSFYVVGTIALFVGLACFLGLRNLQGEEGKGWRMLLGRPDYQAVPSDEDGETEFEGPIHTPIPFLPYWRLILDSTILGFKDSRIGLGYVGGFVARASSVGISLFIPLYVNAYFIGHGFCQGSPNDPSPELKKECRAAYVLAAELTGVSQLVALLCAPLFGYLSDRYRRFNIPLLVAAVTGMTGFTAFAQLESPEITNIDGRGGSPVVFLIVALIGISQIGAIVCSLGLLGRGVQGDDGGYNLSAQLEEDYYSRITYSDTPDSVGLVDEQAYAEQRKSRGHLKGSIAGVYSLSGGVAILLLTKLGGYLFDSMSTGAPFYMMAIFNAVLLVIGIGTALYRELPRPRKGIMIS